MRHLISMTAIFVALSTFATFTYSQQPNTPDIVLSVNGTGQLDNMGSPLATNSEVTLIPPGSTAAHHHLAAPVVSLEIRLESTPIVPVLLGFGNATLSTPIGSNSLDIDPATAQIIVDGINPSQLLDFTAFTASNGTWKLNLPQGLPGVFPLFSLQALTLDPTAPSPGLRFSAAVSVDIDPSLDTFGRNVCDALNQIVENSSYLHSTLSSDFKHEGLDKNQFIAHHASTLLGLNPNDRAGIVTFEEMGPPTPADPLLPTIPAAGQDVEAYLQVREDFLADPCVVGLPFFERSRFYGLHFVEDALVWRLAGDQRDVAIDSEMSFFPGNENADGISPFLDFRVIDMTGQRGGVSGVTVTGPQLANIVGITALSAASGTANMVFESNSGVGSTWQIEVGLANAVLGSSRMPLVVNSSGIRDAYTFMVSWNDSTTSGPYTFPIRASLDVDANPAAVAAAMPGMIFAPTATLNSAGTLSANTDIGLHLGSLPSSEFSYLYFNFSQPLLLEAEAGFTPPYVPGSTFNFNICSPFFTTGVSTSFFSHVVDIYCTCYTGFGLIPGF